MLWNQLRSKPLNERNVLTAETNLAIAVGGFLSLRREGIARFDALAPIFDNEEAALSALA